MFEITEYTEAHVASATNPMQVREKCLGLLGLPPQIIEAQPTEKPSEPAKRLRLAWWR